MKRVSFFLFTLAFCLYGVGCRMDMQDQPKYKAYRGSTFFKDGLSSRPLPEGTVPRGYLRADAELYTGKKNTAQAAQSASSGQNTPGQQNQTGRGSAQNGGASGANNSGSQGTQTGMNANTQGTQSSGLANKQAGGTAADVFPNDVDIFPFPVTEAVLKRGEERYQVYCSMCHGLTGYGDGMIVRRGYRRPPSYYEDRLRKAPVGHFYDVITNGWGAMPNYATQIPVQDRWAIVAYVRALQMTVQESQPNTSSAQRPNNPESGGQR